MLAVDIPAVVVAVADAAAAAAAAAFGWLQQLQQQQNISLHLGHLGGFMALLMCLL